METDGTQGQLWIEKTRRQMALRVSYGLRRHGDRWHSGSAMHGEDMETDGSSGSAMHGEDTDSGCAMHGEDTEID
jgi:hypothetical protein